MERTDGISPTAKAGAIMTKEKLCRIAIDYPEEERKGWYSYELSGRSLFMGICNLWLKNTENKFCYKTHSQNLVERKC